MASGDDLVAPRDQCLEHRLDGGELERLVRHARLDAGFGTFPVRAYVVLTS